MIQTILSTREWLIDPDVLSQFLSRIKNIDCRENALNMELKGVYAEDYNPDRPPYSIDGGIATIPIHGPLLKKTGSGFLSWLLGISSYESIGKSFQAAMSDSSIFGIFLDLDSPGGVVSGCSELADEIFAARGVKPVLSFVDGQATSAAQWLASAARFTAVSSESARLGSIGVTGVHFDKVDLAKNIGVLPTVFSSGKFKSSGTEWQHLSESDKEYIQGQFSYLHGLFIDAMVRNTGIPENKLAKDLKEAKIYFGSQAIKVKLADAVMNRKQAISKLKSMIKPSQNSGTKTTASKIITKMEAPNMELQKMGLLKLIEQVKRCDTVDALAKVESEIVPECQRRISSADDWIEKEQAQHLNKQIKKVISDHRRHLMSVIDFNNDRAKYDLGRSIAKGR